MRKLLLSGLVGLFLFPWALAQEKEAQPQKVEARLSPKSILSKSQNESGTLIKGGKDLTGNSSGQSIPGHKVRQNSGDSPELAHYHFAIHLKDYPTAIQALSKYIVLNPDQERYLDTLVALYYYGGQYQPCVNLAKIRLDQEAQNAPVREYLAMAYQQIDHRKSALDQYEILYQENKRLYHLYQIASLQYQVERFGECALSIEKLKIASDLQDESVELRSGNVLQTVPMEAALYNLQGSLARQRNRPSEAASAYRKAIKRYPNFVLAKQNLEILREEEERINDR